MQNVQQKIIEIFKTSYSSTVLFCLLTLWFTYFNSYKQ